MFQQQWALLVVGVVSLAVHEPTALSGDLPQVPQVIEAINQQVVSSAQTATDAATESSKEKESGVNPVTSANSAGGQGQAEANKKQTEGIAKVNDIVSDALTTAKEATSNVSTQVHTGTENSKNQAQGAHKNAAEAEAKGSEAGNLPSQAKTKTTTPTPDIPETPTPPQPEPPSPPSVPRIPEGVFGGPTQQDSIIANKP